MPNPSKPIALKRLAGNPGRRPLPETTPSTGDSAPEMPSFLRGDARREWRRIVPELEQRGILARIDLAVLAMYCGAWGRYVEAEKMVKKHGAVTVAPSSYEQKSHWLTIADKAQDQLRRLATELGLSPAARNRVVGTPQDDDGADFFAVRR